MGEAFEQAKPRVNASMLPQHIGKFVCLLGEVMDVDPNGLMFAVKTSDGQRVQINLPEPLEEMVSGTVEIVGEVTNNCQVTCQSYILFGGDFDMNLYDEAIKLATEHSKYYPLSESSNF
ncbi:PREDICTED: replication protein A 14 kDa subunit-like [Branchiostoma belcheri]|uniref:Replication protein A 14 kDa subunit-like n=1 Tax=Branchiostoma belcheri TaxID=7741 RepID=A0A6P4ZYQ8_BRABE|nr:PREDICTED: replication protein A 14 kDa subunit-like [Branchiostoma belcheri]XP_019636103.1 PREDICTED: replication protein A 14 kDa subunit-like [Branchiostoma belcheri]KAI8516188.1 60S acidic ribosomal protein P1-alpha 3 [Branchiostoma belcheri]